MSTEGAGPLHPAPHSGGHALHLAFVLEPPGIWTAPSPRISPWVFRL